MVTECDWFIESSGPASRCSGTEELRPFCQEIMIRGEALLVGNLPNEDIESLAEFVVEHMRH
jgi:hypothetical protein